MAFEGEPPEYCPDTDANTLADDAARVFVNWSYGGDADEECEPMELQVRGRCVYLMARL